MGDSLTSGYQLPPNEAFPSTLERLLIGNGHKVKIFNAGISGDTSKSGYERLNWILGEKSDMIIIELGANDGLRGLKPDDTYQNLDKIIKKCLDFDKKVLFVGMQASPSMGKKYVNEFNKIYTDLAKKYGLNKNFKFYPFFLDGVIGDKQLVYSDGLHPTKEGVIVIAEKIYPFIEELLRLIDLDMAKN